MNSAESPASAGALIVIDVQDGLDDPKLSARNNPQAEENMARLLANWRARGAPIFHIQHMSRRPTSTLRPNQPGNAIKQIVAPQGEEPVLQKSVNCAFIGTDLEARLRQADIDTLVMVGLTTGHCVSSTARLASDLGFRTYVVADATAAHAVTGFDGTYYPPQLIHDNALATLHGEFSTVLTTDQLLALVATP